MTTKTRLLDKRYFFACPPLRQESSYPCPVLVVAVAGAARDWAAYVGGIGYGADDDTKAEAVHRYGGKLPEPVARAFFPNIELEYRR